MLTIRNLECRAKHWKLVPQSNEEYPGFMKEMLTVILRHLSGKSSSDGFKFELSDEQQRSLQVLEDVLQQRDGREALACCHNLLWTVMSAKDRGGWTDVMQQWLWLRALWPDRNFYSLTSLTPDLAKVKYMIRQTTLLQAFVQPLASEEELLE